MKAFIAHAAVETELHMRILCSDSRADLAKSLEEKDVQHEITLHTLLDKVQALLLDTSQDLQPH